MPPLSKQNKLDLSEVIRMASARGASDVDIAPRMPLIFKVDGILGADKDYIVTDDDTYTIAEKYLDAATREKYDERKSYDIALAPSPDFDVNNRVRIHFYESLGRKCLTCRLIPLEPQSMKDLGIPPILTKWLETRGLTVISGYFGVGKTTTIASLVDYINETQKEKIIILEDPVEFLHENKESFIFQREVGPHADSPSYANALMDIAREHANTAVIGEIRNLEAMEAAFSMTESGMNVVTSIHAPTASRTIKRILGWYPASDHEMTCKRLTTVLKGILCQQLMLAKKGGRALVAEILTISDKTEEALSRGDINEIEALLEKGSGELCSFAKSKEVFEREGII